MAISSLPVSARDRVPWQDRGDKYVDAVAVFGGEVNPTVGATPFCACHRWIKLGGDGIDAVVGGVDDEELAFGQRAVRPSGRLATHAVRGSRGAAYEHR